MRVIVVNILGIVLGVLIAAGILNTHLFAQSSVKKAIDASNNDYSFPTEEDFKGHELLEKKNQSMDAFSQKKPEIEEDVIDNKMAKYAKQDLKKEQEEALKDQRNAKQSIKDYQAYLKARKKMKKEMEEELKEELDEYTISSADARPLKFEGLDEDE